MNVISKLSPLFFRRLRYVAACALVALPGISLAADFPERSVRMVVPFPAGGGTDMTARILAKHLSEQWGQSVVVENRSGARHNVLTYRTSSDVDYA